MRSLRRLVGMRSKNLSKQLASRIQVLATPINPLICQNENTTKFVDPKDNRNLLKLNTPIPITLGAREELAPDTFVYRFALPEDRPLGHFTCQYLQFEAEIKGEKYTRYYHPMSKVTDDGYLDLLIKVYLRNFQHQAGGVFSQFIDRMKEGDGSLTISAIGGDIVYLGNSKFLLRNEETNEMEERVFNKVGMIAAGSGITPMFQLSQTVIDSGYDDTGLSLIYTNRTPFDIILDEDLTEFEKAGKLCYFPVVQNPDENWVMGQGRISEEMIKSFMPDPYENLDDSLIIVCGPPKLKDEMKRVMVDEMGYTNTFFFN